jgi:hypothetical protein
MTLTSSPHFDDSFRVQLEQERQAFWQARPGWPEGALQQAWFDQLTERLFTAELATNVDHASIPRHLRHGFGVTGTSPALVAGADRARLVGAFLVVDTGHG